ELKGDDKDANAEKWVNDATDGKKGELEGDWSGRWKGSADGNWTSNSEPVKIATAGDRVYIHYKDSGDYLIVAVREGKNLIGRWIDITDPNSMMGVFTAVIVDDERIDGAWDDGSGVGRWDFRRKLK